jgi:hypothetical protein
MRLWEQYFYYISEGKKWIQKAIEKQSVQENKKIIQKGKKRNAEK